MCLIDGSHQNFVPVLLDLFGYKNWCLKVLRFKEALVHGLGMAWMDIFSSLQHLTGVLCADVFFLVGTMESQSIKSAVTFTHLQHLRIYGQILSSYTLFIPVQTWYILNNKCNIALAWYETYIIDMYFHFIFHLLSYQSTWSFKALFAKLLANASTACRKGRFFVAENQPVQPENLSWKMGETWKHELHLSPVKESCEVMMRLWFLFLKYTTKPMNSPSKNICETEGTWKMSKFSLQKDHVYTEPSFGIYTNDLFQCYAKFWKHHTNNTNIWL